MSKFKLINLVDKLFITISIFLILFAWINFYIRDLWTTFLLSILFTFSLVYILYFILEMKNSKSINLKKSENEIETTFLTFKLSPKENKLNLLNECFKTKYLTVLKNKCLHYIENNKKICVILATHIPFISQNDLINLIDEFFLSNADGFDIICNQTKGPLNLNIYKNKQIKITNKNRLFELFKSTNIEPNKSEINFNLNKISLKQILISLFAQNKAKHYFMYGLLLIVSSIILPFQAYYIVIGSMLLLFGILSKILPKFKS